MRVFRIQRKREPGFTLIEMMIVIAVFAIIAAIAIPSFMSMLPGMRLNGAARQVMVDLMAARMNAVKQNNKVRVFFNSPGTNQYQILDDDDNDGTADTGEALTTKNIQDKFLHAIFFLYFFDKIKPAEINGPFDDDFRRGLIPVSIPKKLFSHFTKS